MRGPSWVKSKAEKRIENDAKPIKVSPWDKVWVPQVRSRAENASLFETWRILEAQTESSQLVT